MKKGKLIVLDGTDGSGKATQTRLLVSRLKKNKISVRTLDFPQYYNNFFGKFIGECQAGKHGDFLNIDPKIASVLYAADRFESKKKIDDWLRKGYVVILDRYTSSAQMHQGGKITNIKKRKEFFKWLEEMEFGVFGIPKPDAIIYLDLSIDIVWSLLSEKTAKSKKQYVDGGVDMVEKDKKYLLNAQKSALKIIEDNNKWYKIECAPKKKMKSREEIHNMVFDVVRGILKLKKSI